MLVPGVSAASDDGMLVPDSAHAAAESETASVKRLRLAIVNSYGMSIMDDYYSRTIEAVKEKLTPIEIDVKIYGPDSFLKAAEKESFDMSIASSGLTSLMIERTGGLPLAAVVSDEAPDPNYANGAAIIVRADRPELRTLEDLRGRSVAIMSRTAFAGWQIPASEMVRKGLDPEAFFYEIRLSGYPMTRIVQEVKSGEVDVGFVATCLLERMARAGQIDQKDFRVIGEHADRLVACRHSTELYPNWFFSIKPSVPTSVARTLTATLLDVPAAPDGTQWTISNDNRRLFEVFRAGSFGINLLGATPLDFSTGGMLESLRAAAARAGYTINACWAMGDKLESLANTAAARVNVVVSSSGLPLAQCFERCFGTPYVCGLPVGGLAPRWHAAVEWAAKNRCSVPAADFLGADAGGTRTAVLGEPLAAACTAAAVNLEQPGSCRALSPLPSLGIEAPILSSNLSEDLLRAMLGGTEVLAADPLFDIIAEEARVGRTIAFPHEACSGRMYRSGIVNILERAPFDALVGNLLDTAK